MLPGRRAERRRRLAGPDLEFRTFCRTKRMLSSTSAQMERAWDAWQAERYRRGETGQQPAYTDNLIVHSAGADSPDRNPQAENCCSGNWTP